jgi:carboxyl-terminal processing protease
MNRRVIALLVSIWFALACGALAAPAEKAAPPKDDYYELYRMLADTVDQVDRNYVKEIDRRELIEAAIKGVMSRLDPYSMYIGPQEFGQFRSSVESEFGGIGIHVSMEDGELKVLSPIYGSPAYRAGILAGDRIVEIEGKNAEGISPDEAIQRMKGKEGTAVRLVIVHAGSLQRIKLSLMREKIRVPTVLGERRKRDGAWDYMLDAKQHIGYIRVTAFSRETGNELQRALEQLKSAGMKRLVLDLRFNPGGLLSSAIEVSNLFISQGRIVSTKGRNTPERCWDADKKGAFGGFPMAVLVNHYSASASEIVSACLQDHQRAVVVGERSWGKGSVQNIIPLEADRSALKLTTATFYRPSGKNIHRFPAAKDSDQWGVSPDSGFELKLSERETSRLLNERRDRELMMPEEGPQTPASKAPSAQAAPTKTAKSGPAAKPQAKAAAKKPATADRQLELALKYLSGK